MPYKRKYARTRYSRRYRARSRYPRKNYSRKVRRFSHKEKKAFIAGMKAALRGRRLKKFFKK